MALPKTDAFTAADGTALTTYDASYSAGGGAFSINSNAIYGSATNGAGFVVANWGGDTFGAAQYAELTLAGSGVSGTYIGVGVRISGGNGYYFFASIADGVSFFGELTAGSGTDIGGDRGSFVAGDVLRLEVDSEFGFTLKKNGTTIATASDGGSLHATGSGGMTGYGGSTSARADNLDTGNVGGGGGGGTQALEESSWSSAMEPKTENLFVGLWG